MFYLRDSKIRCSLSQAKQEVGCKEDLWANQADLQKRSGGAGTGTETGQDCETIRTITSTAAT